MATSLDREAFEKRFKQRALIISRLAAGQARDLAAKVNAAEGRGDGSLHTKAEYSALFGELAALGPSPDQIIVTDEQGAPTPVGTLVDLYAAATIDQAGFFTQSMYVIRITGWPRDKMQPEEPVKAPANAELAVWPTDPADSHQVPAPGGGGALFATSTFSLMNSGNRTLRVPKRSWKIDVQPTDDGDTLLGMRRFNLKAMYNDPSQMREALAWHLFGVVGVPAARHTYAKLAFDDRYYGLFSLIEQVDKRFLRGHFGRNDVGNLYKAYCGDIGCATLEHRVGQGGDDSGREYTGTKRDTYRLKANDDDPVASTYDDLARFVRVINGIGLPGDDSRFNTDAFRSAVEGIMNVRAFLRWAALNLLIGSWDNYFATPANYYLYNSGFRGAEKDFMDLPYFTFIPWDYDNSFGIDYFGTQWQYTDILDWPSNSAQYWASSGHPDRRSSIPLVQNLLKNGDFRRYYLGCIDHLLGTEFTPDAIDARMRGTGPDTLWDRVSQAAYLESNTPWGPPFTGRQFTNDEVYQAAHEQFELRHGQSKMEGIVHYVIMRSDRARAQLASLGAAATRPEDFSFPSVMEPLPVAS